MAILTFVGICLCVHFDFKELGRKTRLPQNDMHGLIGKMGMSTLHLMLIICPT